MKKNYFFLPILVIFTITIAGNKQPGAAEIIKKIANAYGMNTTPGEGTSYIDVDPATCAMILYRSSDDKPEELIRTPSRMIKALSNSAGQPANKFSEEEALLEIHDRVRTMKDKQNHYNRYNNPTTLKSSILFIPYFLRNQTSYWSESRVILFLETIIEKKSRSMFIINGITTIWAYLGLYSILQNEKQTGATTLLKAQGFHFVAGKLSDHVAFCYKERKEGKKYYTIGRFSDDGFEQLLAHKPKHLVEQFEKGRKDRSKPQFSLLFFGKFLKQLPLGKKFTAWYQKLNDRNKFYDLGYRGFQLPANRSKDLVEQFERGRRDRFNSSL